MSELGVILVVNAILICFTPLTFYGLLYLAVIFCNSHMQTKRIHLLTLIQSILKVKLQPKLTDQSCKSRLRKELCKQLYCMDGDPRKDCRRYHSLSLGRFSHNCLCVNTLTMSHECTLYNDS